jgi:two-component system chemotaxis sensor kinase CheA
MSGELQYGLIVDQVDDTEEIVVKPLSKFFQNVSIYSGASIMGDGTISLILDIEALGKSADIQSNKKNTVTTNLNRTKVASTALTFSLGGDEIFGVQMSQISRLEEIKLSDIEFSGDQEVIQYRGDVLPVVRLSKFMDIEENYDHESANLIVFNIAGKEAALLVRKIIDSVDLEGELDNDVIEHPLILGTMILRNQVVLLLDAVKVFNMSFTKWDSPKNELLSTRKQRILYVDDSPFYLKVVKRYLSDGGYDIDTCQDSIESLDVIKEGEYDLFIFDFEMPGMDGKELTKKVREMERFNYTPIIILTALTGGNEKKSIINSGIQSYLVKLNKDELLSEIEKLLALELVEA